MRLLLRLFATVALLVGGLAVVVVPAGVAAAADETVASISAGGSSTCAVTTAGAAKCWGWNHDGQLGDGTNVDAVVPVDVSGLGSGVTAISATGFHTCAVVAGAVKCWGFNSAGELGDGSTNESNVPVDVTGLGAGATAVAVSGSASCAIVARGAVKCWGDNTFGELGDGTTDESHVPVDVTGLGAGVAAITGGGGYACALTAAGAVKCWGNNANGRLGDGTTTNRLAPVGVSGLGSGVTAISGIEGHTCAVASGAVKCWGDNEFGQLGDGSTTDAHTPVDVAGAASGFATVSAGGEHTCAVTTDGGVECWGRNDWGQLGHGPGADSHTPVAVAGLGSGVTSVSAGGVYTCALTADAAMLCWGNNFSGQLGNGTASQLLTPNPVSGLVSGVASVAAGYHHSCAVMTDGTAQCWGLNDHGQVGDGTTLERDRAVAVAGLGSDVATIAAGDEHTCALTTGGAVECWGNNEHGQLGDGTTTERNAPVPVAGLDSGVVAITVGVQHTCALTDTGAVKCWGGNNEGELGDGGNTDRHTPVTVSGLGSGVAGIAAGGTHSCAVTTGGAVKCWGGVDAPLGDGTTQSSNVPVDVVGLSSGVASISAGEPNCAVTTAGALKCWGDGYLGDGSVSVGLTPVDVPSVGTNVAAVESSALGGCLLMKNAGAQCWGYNAYGEIGDGTTTDRDRPVDVSGLGSGVAAISAKGDHACAVTTTGAAECWGNNTTGQLGDGFSGFSTVPVGVVGLGLNGALPPDAPGSVSASATNDAAANIAWTPPADDGGAPVYGYLVTITSASGGVPSGVTGSRVRLATGGLTLATNTSLRVGGLTAGTGYRLDVAPINRAGIGASILSEVVRPGASPPAAGGYWMVGATGSAYAFGTASYFGGAHLPFVTHIEPTPSRHGYWIVNAAGTVVARGDARVLPGVGPLAAGEVVTGLTSTQTGHGYWLFTNRGRAIARGDAKFFGDLHASTLEGSIVGSVATPTGKGYYMVGSDGGVFAFGDARFRGSMGAKHLNAPVVALVPTADNHGYWLVASDGGIFAFGAPFRGSLGGHRLNRPVTGMVRYGNGYLMVATDGGVFDFSNLAFRGSLAGHPPSRPIVSVAARS